MSPSLPFLPDDLIVEVLSLLKVKSILRFRCVSKYWDTLITDPTFVNLHLNKSAKRNTHFLLITHHITDIPGSDNRYVRDYGVIPYSISTILDNPSFTISVDSYYLVQHKGCSNVVGSCNGLICLIGRSVARDQYGCSYFEYSLRLWNPATRTTSPKLGFLRLFNSSSVFPSSYDGHYNFLFGYDNSTYTYKAVASRYDSRQRRSEVKILTMGDNVWRDIQSFPVDPLHFGNGSELYDDNCGVYFKSSINWLAIHNNGGCGYLNCRNNKDVTVKQFVIASLDLGTETYSLYLPPSGFNEVPPTEPNVDVLGGCLTFSYCYQETHFIIWQMKEFRVQDSWTQFLKISYHNLQIRYDYSDETMKYAFNLAPLFLSEDGDTLILHCNQESKDIIYNWRNNKVERTNIIARKTITDDRTRNETFCAAENYFESLVSVF